MSEQETNEQSAAKPFSPTSFDAMDWAREFLRCSQITPEIATDLGTMHGWFANALMAGHDHARHMDAAALQQLREQVMAANQRALQAQRQMRDEFAMAALTGMLAFGKTNGRDSGYLAQESYRIADALMSVRALKQEAKA